MVTHVSGTDRSELADGESANIVFAAVRDRPQVFQISQILSDYPAWLFVRIR